MFDFKGWGSRDSRKSTQVKAPKGMFDDCYRRIIEEFERWVLESEAMEEEESVSKSVAVTACTAMALFYIAILYAPTLILRLPPPTSFKSFLIRRFVCAAVSSVVSLVVSALILPVTSLLFPVPILYYCVFIIYGYDRGYDFELKVQLIEIYFLC